MGRSGKMLVWAGRISFAMAGFQAIIGVSPTWSLYFGAPASLVENLPLLVGTSLAVSALMVVFGMYAFSGAGRIRRLPCLKPVLVGIGMIFFLRGLMLIPESLVVMGLLSSSIPVAPRFVGFSFGALLVGYTFLGGTLREWKSLPGPS